MPGTTAKSYFWRGVRDGAPFVLVVGPFGLLFGVVGTEAGLNIVEVMGFSILVIAGASQFAAVQLLSDNAPTLIVLATALAVNLRMAMYSAALVPHLGAAPLWKRALMAYFLVDQSYAVGAVKFDTEPQMTLQQKVAYYFGIVAPICPNWYLLTLVGALVGKSIPPSFALDFAIPITFLALVAPGLRTVAHVAAATTSVAVALALAFLPYNSGLLIAALAAMITGAQVELWTKGRMA
ncbi:AzlC family ABC transporter permease [Actibacterium sp.]|uniref:AzlC family ABC transporter permease n=1 Tax=Actibacterium sp. TaxID=1872125 RepID=UPI003561ED20